MKTKLKVRCNVQSQFDVACTCGPPSLTSALRSRRVEWSSRRRVVLIGSSSPRRPRRWRLLPQQSAPYAGASSCARLPGAECARASRAAAAFFPSRPRPAALAARAGAGSSRSLAAAAAASQKKLMGSLTNAEGLRFGVVVARFNEVVTNLLLQGALETFERYSVRAEDITVVSVPGSFEVPITAQKLGKSGKFDAILCIGAVIRGDTTHYDAVANSAASGVLNAGLSAGIPCVFGVLTCEDMDQALNRAGGKAGNKGAEAAITAIEMASLFRHHLC